MRVLQPGLEPGPNGARAVHAVADKQQGRRGSHPAAEAEADAVRRERGGRDRGGELLYSEQWAGLGAVRRAGHHQDGAEAEAAIVQLEDLTR